MSFLNLAEAARVAERLAEHLSRIDSGDAGWAASALTAIDRLADLRADLEARYKSYLADQITAAAGNAATHDWQVSDSGSGLVCSRCKCSALPASLLDGQAPACPDWCARFSSLVGHSVYANYDGTSTCIYCKTVYPTTAADREAVSS